MLPILPALLLLFLQGPANIERLALEGRLPMVLEAAHRLDAQDEKAFAALFAASNTTELSSAILALMQWTESESVPSPAKPIAVFAAIDTRPPLAIKEGFRCCQRSRDGPFSMV